MSDLNPSLMIGSTIGGTGVLSSVIPFAYILLYFLIGRNQGGTNQPIRYLWQFLSPLTKRDKWQTASKQMAKVLYGGVDGGSQMQVSFIGSLIAFIVMVYTYASIVASRKVAGCQDKERAWLTFFTSVSNNLFLFTLVAFVYYTFANNFRTAVGYKLDAVKNMTGLMVLNIIVILVRMYFKVREYKIDRSEQRPWYKRWTIDLLPFVGASPFMSALYVPVLTVVGYQLMKMYYSADNSSQSLGVTRKGFILYLIIMAMGLGISFSMPYIDAYLKNVGGAFSLCRQEE